MNIARLQLKLPEFSETTFINYNFHIFETHTKYDMIIGQDLMRQLGIKIDFETDQVQLRDLSVPIKPINCTNESFFVQDSEIAEEAIEIIKNILDAKYEAADLDQIVAKSVHLNNHEQQKL